MERRILLEESRRRRSMSRVASALAQSRWAQGHTLAQRLAVPVSRCLPGERSRNSTDPRHFSSLHAAGEFEGGLQVTWEWELNPSSIPGEFPGQGCQSVVQRNGSEAARFAWAVGASFPLLQPRHPALEESERASSAEGWLQRVELQTQVPDHRVRTPALGGREGGISLTLALP